MKGIIFNLLEQFITEKLGEEGYEEILAETPLRTQEPFVVPGLYPDEDLMAIVNMITIKMGITQPEALRAFGKFCVPKLAAKFPIFIANHKHPKPFLMTVDSIVHVEVKKLFKDAEPPCFSYEDPAPDRLVIRYISKRRLCQFMEGIIEGVGDFYNSPIRYEQRGCMLDGATECEFDLAFGPRGS